MSKKSIDLVEFDDDFFDDFLVCVKCNDIVSMDNLRKHVKKHHPNAEVLDWQSILDFYNERSH